MQRASRLAEAASDPVVTRSLRAPGSYSRGREAGRCRAMTAGLARRRLWVVGIVALVIAAVQDKPAAQVAEMDIAAALAPFDLANQLSSGIGLESARGGKPRLGYSEQSGR